MHPGREGRRPEGCRPGRSTEGCGAGWCCGRVRGSPRRSLRRSPGRSPGCRCALRRDSVRTRALRAVRQGTLQTLLPRASRGERARPRFARAGSQDGEDRPPRAFRAEPRVLHGEAHRRGREDGGGGCQRRGRLQGQALRSRGAQRHGALGRVRQRDRALRLRRELLGHHRFGRRRQHAHRDPGRPQGRNSHHHPGRYRSDRWPIRSPSTSSRT
jgi:hypothetical protein